MLNFGGLVIVSLILCGFHGLNLVFPAIAKPFNDILEGNQGGLDFLSRDTQITWRPDRLYCVVVSSFKGLIWANRREGRRFRFNLQIRFVRTSTVRFFPVLLLSLYAGLFGLRSLLSLNLLRGWGKWLMRDSGRSGSEFAYLIS